MNDSPQVSSFRSEEKNQNNISKSKAIEIVEIKIQSWSRSH